jgi:hypothetical protein
MCPVLRSMVAAIRDVPAVLIAVIDKRGDCAAFFVGHGHGYGDGADADGFEAGRRVDQHFDHSRLVGLPGLAVRRLNRDIEVARQLDYFRVGVADR